MPASTAETKATIKNKLNIIHFPLESPLTIPQAIQNPAAPTTAPPVAHLIRLRELPARRRSVIATKRLPVSIEETLTATPIPAPASMSEKKEDQPP